MVSLSFKQLFCRHKYKEVAGYFALNTMEFSKLKVCEKCKKKIMINGKD